MLQTYLGHPMFYGEGENLKYVVNAKEMKECDRVTMEEYGIPSLVLMERAALAVADVLMDGSFPTEKVLVVCGSGNNGGDGFAAARILFERKIQVSILFAGKEKSMTKDARIQKKICENYGINIVSNTEVGEYTCIVDAIFGVGLSREVEGHYRELIEEINACRAKVLAVDIPSGISADTGKVMGTAVRAKKTVTFAFAKTGLMLYPGAEYCGKVLVREIGITEKSFQKIPQVCHMEQEDLYLFPKRSVYSNKGTYGKALLVAGQKNMCGAAFLAGKAAYRMGTGLVKVCTEECNREIIQGRLPEALLTTYEAESFSENREVLYGWPTAAGIGPGFGVGAGKWELLRSFLSESRCPLVLDADALNLLSGRMEYLKKCTSPVVVTPHVGEMARLAGLTKEEVLSDLMGTCRGFAKEYGIVCVLKDTRTVISDGEEICINLTGTDGMATGGSGDILAGMLTGLLAQGMEAFCAAKLAVWIHGKAGEMAAKRLGRHAMLAGDILEEIPKILCKEEKCDEET